MRQSKTGRPVVIPVIGPLAEALETAPRVATVIVADERGLPWSAHHFRHVFKRIMRAAGVEGVRFQDLRRTAIVRLAEAGCTVPEIAAISGHQIDYCQRILEVYLPRTRRLAERAVVKLLRNGTGTRGPKGGQRGVQRVQRAMAKSSRTGAPGGIRTHDPRIRNPMLYPAELRAPAIPISPVPAGGQGGTRRDRPRGAPRRRDGPAAPPSRRARPRARGRAGAMAPAVGPEGAAATSGPSP